jgi:hypothetical protein
MDHSAVITTNPSGFGQPVHAQCSCNTAGDFPTVQAASDWMIFQHFSRLGVTDTYSLTSGDLPDVKKVKPVATGKLGRTYTPQLPGVKNPIKSFPPKAGA